jgi:hypothetical protein
LITREQKAKSEERKLKVQAKAFVAEAEAVAVTLLTMAMEAAVKAEVKEWEAARWRAEAEEVKTLGRSLAVVEAVAWQATAMEAEAEAWRAVQAKARTKAMEAKAKAVAWQAEAERETRRQVIIHDKLSSEEIEARRKLELLDLPDAIAHMENGGQVYRYGSEDRFFYKIEDGVLLCRCNELGGWRPAIRSLRDNDKLYIATVDWHSGEFPLRVWTTLLPLPNRNMDKSEY